MKKMNLAPTMALQSSATVVNGHLPDKWRDPETEAGTRLEAWGDLTGLSLDSRGVLEARQKELGVTLRRSKCGRESQEIRPERTVGK